MTDTRPRLPMTPHAAPEPVEAIAGPGRASAEPVEPDALRARIIEVLRDIYDPEIPVNIHDLGLIYRLEVDESGVAHIAMTLTAPACPVAGPLVQEVADRVGGVEGVCQARVKLVWDPPWTRERMSEEALLELGLL